MARGDELVKGRLDASNRAAGSPRTPQDIEIHIANYVERYYGPLLREFNQFKEKVGVLTGERGDGSQRALTPANPGETTTGGGDTIVVTNPPPNASEPTQPTSVTASGAFTRIVVQWDAAQYQGHKNNQVWRNTVDDFGTATLVHTTEANIYGDAVDLGAKFYYWVRFINLLDEPGPASQSAYAETAINITAEMERLSDFINSTQLAQALRDRIDLIDEPDTGILDRLQQEIDDRIAAIQQEIGDRTTAIQEESIQRQNALSAESTQRNLLAAQMRGNYTGTDLNMVSEGFLYQERTARTTAVSSLAQQISLLTAGVSGGFDPLQTWYFDADSQGWEVAGATLFWNAGWIRVISTGVDPRLIRSGLSIVGAEYSTIKLRIKRIAGTGWDGALYYTTAGHGFSSGFMQTLPDPDLADGDIAVLEFDFSSVGDWTASTITALRIDLGDSDSDIFDIDWIAVGRNGPGASVASLLNEELARANADAAEVNARSVLSTKLVGTSDPSSITNLNQVTSGLLADERNARSTADAAEVNARQTLSVKMIGVPDPNTIGGLSQVTSGLLADERNARASANSARVQDITTINARLDNPLTGLAATAAGLNSLTTTVEQQGNQISANAQSLNQIQAIVGPNYAALQTIYDVTVGPNGYSASAVLKTDVNGYIAGWGLWNTGATSQAIFNVDTFAIGRVGSGTVYPFIVDNGVIYIDTLRVKVGSIESAQLKEVNVDKIVGNKASFVVSNIGDATLDFAKITNTVQSSNYAFSATGWRIDKTGWAEFRNIVARGDIEASSIKSGVAVVYEANIVNANVTTLKLAGNSVTVMTGGQSGNGPATTIVAVSAADLSNGPVPIIVTMSRHQGSTAYFCLGVGTPWGSFDQLFGSLPSLGVWAYTYIYTVSVAGTYSFSTFDQGGGYPNVHNCSITAILGKR